MRFTPTKKISELPALSPATLDTTFVVGISGSTTYKISINQLTSSLDTTFATDLVTTALSNSLNSKLSTSSYSTDSASFNSRIISGSAVAGTISGSQQISALGFVTGSYTTINSFNTLTQSFNSISQSFNIISGSVGTIDFTKYATTGSNTFNGNETITGSLFVSGTTEFGGDLVPKEARGATLGTELRPFKGIFVSSGSINIASDIIGDPNTTLSNVRGNILVSAGGMRLIGDASFIATTGSFQYISGSMRQVGNYTQDGNYVMVGNKTITGSLNITGSTNFSELTGSLQSFSSSVDYRIQNISLTPGASGSSGTSGTSGTNGVQGPQGENGTAGSSGVQGPTGPQGVNGSNGVQGSQGPIGPQGNQGNQGNQGPQGNQGVNGSSGINGTSGTNGAQGNQGPTGSQGNQGNTGPQGTTGAQGTQGNQGPTGSQGNQGANGTSGAQGNQGPTGVQGATGSQGNQGVSGTNGTSGFSIVSGSFATTSSVTTISASAWGAFQSASSYSSSFYTTINTNIGNITTNSASAWGAFQSASSYSSSLQTSITTLSSSVTTMSSSLDARLDSIEFLTASLGVNATTGSYGSFYDTTTQSGSANTAYPIKLNSYTHQNGISISGSSMMKVSQTGVYDIEFSAQLANGAGSDDIDIWLRKNGTNVDASNTRLSIPSNQKLVASWNWVDTALENDYYEIMWSTTAANVTIAAFATGSAPTRPSVPSIIATIHRVDVGGITYVNSSTGQLIVSSSQTNALTVTGSASFTELTGSLSSFSSSVNSRINTLSSSVSTSLSLVSASLQTSISASNFTIANNSSSLASSITSVSGTFSDLILNGSKINANGVINTDYINAGRITSDQTSMGVNNDIVFNYANVSSGISLNTSTGVFTLTANKTYKLFAELSFSNFSDLANGYIIYDWVDATTNTRLATTGIGAGVGEHINRNTNEFNATSTTLIYTPTTNQTIKVRIVEAAGTVTVRASIGTKATIEQINSSFALNTLSGGINYTQVLGNQRNGISSAGTSIVSGSITTTGKPVQIIVSGDANPTSGTGQWCSLQIYRDGSAIGNGIQLEAANQNENQGYSLNLIDTPAAGTYTYSLRVPTITGTFQFGEVAGPVLIIKELGSLAIITDTNNSFTGTNVFSGSTTLRGGVNIGTGSGAEGGELTLAYAQTGNTLTGSAASVDIYQDRLRIFEGGGTTRGVYVDLSKAPAGVGGELLWKASGLVNAGTFVSLDNIKATITTSGNRGLSIGAVSTNFTANISGWYGYTGGGSGLSAYSVAYTTTASGSAFGWSFTTEGDGSTYIITDKTNNRVYRITKMIGFNFNNNFISIERLY